FEFDIGLDLFPMLAGVLASVCCGVLGNFLVLRKLSLMGDAISHSVLPGLVIAFIVVSSRDPLAMFVGAAAAGVLTVVLVELVKKLGRVEPGAAMGVVFSVLFALGVLLIESESVRHIDLDADCVLHGQLETLVWFGAPASLAEVGSTLTLSDIPKQIILLAVMTAVAFLFVTLLFKELRIAAFDPALATTLGFSAGVLHYVLMIFVAAATVASFEAVGSILVIAMLICPAATARLLTDRLVTQICVSVCAALAASVGGYVAATAIPSMWGLEPVNAAGSMTVVGGLLLVAAILLSPSHGALVRVLRLRRLARQIAVDDLLAALYRLRERGGTAIEPKALEAVLPRRTLAQALGEAFRRGLVTKDGGSIRLSKSGHDTGASIIRRHRLWETWLVDEAGVSPDHVHDTAERLEHFDSEPAVESRVDPHGKDIPSRG
ncbi:MAG: metal ABC transporter permease, partial [Planctomycetota bacterium]